MATHQDGAACNGPSWGSVLGGTALLVSLVAIGLTVLRAYEPRKAQSPPPPSEKLPQAPGPDNTLKSLAPPPDAPGPDNSIKSGPRQQVEPAVPAPGSDPERTLSPPSRPDSTS